MRLRSYLIALVVVGILPVLIFAGIMVHQSYRQQRENLAQRTIERARAISAALDREFLITIQSMKVLGASTHLEKGQLSEFYGDMQGALAAYRHAWQNITLLDSSGRQLVNLRRPFGSPLPRTGNPETIEQVRQSKEAAIANLSPGPVTGAPAIVVHVPVLKNGEVKYFLNVVFYPTPLTELLLQQKLPSGWIATIVDRNYTIVATTRELTKFFSQPASSTFAAQAKKYREASWRGTTIDGLPAISALHRSDFTGWTVGVTIPLELFEAPLKRSLLILTLGGTLLLLAGVGLAFLFGSRIARPITSLSTAAAALGKGETPHIVTSPINEVNRVARAFENAAASRRRAEQDALKNYERFLTVARATNDAIWDWDLETNHLWWNEGINALFGYSMTDVGPDIAWKYRHIHPEDRDKVVAGVRALIDSAKQFWSDEYRYLRVDGSYVYVFDRGYVIRDDRGKPVRMIGAMLDITERKRVENLLFSLNEELEQKVAQRTQQLETANKELESFSYSVSHDLRAPLRAIDGFSQALLEDFRDKLDEDGIQYLQKVRAAGQRMGELIDDLLSLSRVTRRQPRLETVELSELAKTIAADLQQRQPERRVTFVIAEGLQANGDPSLMRVVLENLIGNAWKFTGKCAEPRIEFGVVQNDGKSAYFLRDNGAGFDMAYAHKMFGAFQRLHGHTEFPGTGIGLATVQRIIHRHGGRVWAEGKVNEGATFYFSLSDQVGAPVGFDSPRARGS
jgi:PAS domain S-box-containing protein